MHLLLPNPALSSYKKYGRIENLGNMSESVTWDLVSLQHVDSPCDDQTQGGGGELSHETHTKLRCADDSVGA